MTSVIKRRNKAGFTPLETRTSQRSLTGFTLIELLLVGLIILILIGLATPRFRNTVSDLIAKDASYNLSNLINYAQERSIIERRNFRIKLNSKDRSYKLVVIEIDPKSGAPVDKNVPGRFGRTFVLPKGVVIESTVDNIVFYPDGGSDKAAVKILDGAKRTGYKIILKGLFGPGVRVEGVTDAKKK